MTQDIISIIITALFSVLTLLVTRYVVPWLKEHTTEAQRKALKQLIEDLVKAAEQLPKFKALAQVGAEKKKQVILWLEEQGVTITSEIEALIETAVFDLNN